MGAALNTTYVGIKNSTINVFWIKPAVSRRNSSRDDDYRCRGVNRRDACTSKQTGGHSSTGSLKQIGQNQAPDLLRRERRDRQKRSTKNKQHKQRSHHDTWNTRHARDTRSTHNAGESTSSDRDTVPRKQDKREQRQQQQQNTMLFWWIS